MESPRIDRNPIHSRVCDWCVQQSKVLQRVENTHFFGRVSKIGKVGRGCHGLDFRIKKPVGEGDGRKSRKFLLKTQAF
jgi:hypothetical protein